MKWLDQLPEKQTGKTDAEPVDDTVAALKTNPGKWAIISESQQRWQRGISALRKRGCQVIQRTQGDTTYIIARWPE